MRTKLSFLLIFLSTCLYAQNWEQVKTDTQTYISGEGWGETIDEADKQALASLISKISVIVSSNYEILEGESKTNEGSDYQRYIENKVSTFSSATLTNTESIVLTNEPDAHVARWVRRSELDRIFQGRKILVMR